MNKNEISNIKQNINIYIDNTIPIEVSDSVVEQAQNLLHETIESVQNKRTLQCYETLYWKIQNVCCTTPENIDTLYTFIINSVKHIQTNYIKNRGLSRDCTIDTFYDLLKTIENVINTLLPILQHVSFIRLVYRRTGHTLEKWLAAIVYEELLREEYSEIVNNLINCFINAICIYRENILNIYCNKNFYTSYTTHIPSNKTIANIQDIYIILHRINQFEKHILPKYIDITLQQYKDFITNYTNNKIVFIEILIVIFLIETYIMNLPPHYYHLSVLWNTISNNKILNKTNTILKDIKIPHIILKEYNRIICTKIHDNILEYTSINLFTICIEECIIKEEYEHLQIITSLAKLNDTYYKMVLQTFNTIIQKKSDTVYTTTINFMGNRTTATSYQAINIVEILLQFIELLETIIKTSFIQYPRDIDIYATRIISSLLSRGDEYYAKCFAIYIDLQLQGRIKKYAVGVSPNNDTTTVRTEKYLQRIIEQVKHCCNKEIFQLELANRTCSRLLQRRYQCESQEVHLIQLQEKECETAFIEKLRGMLQTYNDSYSKKQIDILHEKWILWANKNSNNNNLIETFHVTLLDGSYWPLPEKVILQGDMLKCVQTYEKFYRSYPNYANRTLRWVLIDSYTIVEMKLSTTQSILLKVSAACAVILNIFTNFSSKISAFEILEKTHLTQQHLLECLTTLACANPQDIQEGKTVRVQCKEPDVPLILGTDIFKINKNIVKYLKNIPEPIVLHTVVPRIVVSWDLPSSNINYIQEKDKEKEVLNISSPPSLQSYELIVEDTIETFQQNNPLVIESHIIHFAKQVSIFSATELVNYLIANLPPLKDISLRQIRPILDRLLEKEYLARDSNDPTRFRYEQ